MQSGTSHLKPKMRMVEGTEKFSKTLLDTLRDWSEPLNCGSPNETSSDS